MTLDALLQAEEVNGRSTSSGPSAEEQMAEPHFGDVALGARGSIYGTTYLGGLDNEGVVFEIPHI
jgi:hypothetical protein